MPKGKVKKVFPGGNTCKGFYSYYDHIIAPDATRILVIKGGPGVGKSTFMRWIGEEMLQRGYDIEQHCCSSDNGSLDGVVIPAINVALIDGTAPHIVDPKNPGAVDEIIHLGDYWDEAKLRANKEHILAANRRVGRLFRMAYSQLAEAKVIRDEMESYIAECTDFARVNRAVAKLEREVLDAAPAQYERFPTVRHLFATAISPGGVVHHIETLLPENGRLFLLKGAPGSGRATALARLARYAESRGLDTQVYHCAFIPEEIELLVVPEVRAAFLKQTEEVDFKPPENGPAVTEIDFDRWVDRRALEIYIPALMDARSRFRAALARATDYIRQAKLTHDYMESFYVPAMDFKAIEARRAETLRRILKWAEETTVNRLPRVSAR